MVKVFYVPEGYFTGMVKSHIGENEFNISWDDGSTTSAILKEEDETEDTENEDRWSIMEDYETQTVQVNQEKPGGNGAKTQKQITPPKQPPAPPPQQPATFDDDEEDNEDNEPENDNGNEDNDQDDNEIDT